jgi:S1-C subfamily serine protease
MAKSIATHAVAVIVTLALAMLWLGPFGGRRGPAAPLRQAPSGRVSKDAVLAPVAPPNISPELLRQADADEQINIRVYAETNRGVVHIKTAAGGGGLFGDEVTSGSGSGFLIDKLGHILTNYHVVSGAEELQVILADGSTHDGTIVGVDPTNDVAVVRIQTEADRLWPLAMGDSSQLLVGQKVLALGNPFGLERTLTTGIISSLDRSLKALNGRTIKGIIQTDAAINPGNSGGPLLNSRGEVIGMTTAIVSQVGQSAGIGFAVPINAIHRILKPLIQNGHVVRADLGIRKVYKTDHGLFIIDQVEGGPADRAGLRPLGLKVERYGPYRRTRLDPDSADLIVAIDGKPVHTVDELLSEVEAHAPGDTAKVTTVRGGKTREVKVQLGKS